MSVAWTNWSDLPLPGCSPGSIQHTSIHRQMETRTDRSNLFLATVQNTLHFLDSCHFFRHSICQFKLLFFNPFLLKCNEGLVLDLMWTHPSILPMLMRGWIMTKQRNFCNHQWLFCIDCKWTKTNACISVSSFTLCLTNALHCLCAVMHLCCWLWKLK